MHDSVIQAVIVRGYEGERAGSHRRAGDLVNLSLGREIELSRLWLETLGSPLDVSVVRAAMTPYVPGALDRICRYLVALAGRRRSKGRSAATAFPISG